MSNPTPGVVATTRVMAETLAVFFAFATVVGALCAFSAPLDGTRRVAVGGLLAVGSLCATGLAVAGRRVPRWGIGTLVGAGTVLVPMAVLAAPDARTAVVCGCLLAFTAMDSSYFYSSRAAMAFLGVGVVLTTAALAGRSDVVLPTALALDVILVALTVVTRRLVVRASSAGVDPLTGLANRRGFDDAVQAAVHPSALLSVALLDLDHFKEINDTAGHDAGDRVLCRVADLRGRSLPTGALLARHGGDEFALLMPGLDGNRALAEVRRLAGLLPGVGLSCGVAEYVPGETAAQLMRRADRALYTAKTGGRGRAELDPGPTGPAHLTRPGDAASGAAPTLSIPRS